MSESDSLRADLEAAFDAAEKPERPERPERASRETAPERDSGKPPSIPEREEQTEADSADKLVPPDGDRPRDQFGRFLSKTTEASAEAPEEPTPAEDEDTDQPEPKAAEPDEGPAIAPPQAWSAHAKEQWSQLPRAIREEVLKRESDVTRGFQERAQQINALEPIAKALEPYAQRFALRGESPAAALGQLLAYRDLLERDPIGGVAHIARSYGVDLRQFATALQQSQQPQNPEIQAVLARVDRMEQMQRQKEELVQQAEEARIAQEIDAFRADTAAHPFFDAVRPAMAKLMMHDIAMSLQEAYDHACWAIPDIRARFLDDQKRSAETQRSKAERDAAERARRAAVSVNSAPSSGRPAGKNSRADTVHDAVRAAYERSVAQS